MEIPYIDSLGLTEKPFSLTPDPLFYFESYSHKEALDHLSFFIGQREGFALIHGDVGTGKTTLSRIFLNSLDPRVYNSALILNPIMTDHELLKETIKEFSIRSNFNSKKEDLDALKEFLLNEHREGKTSILVIDEAQLISDSLFDFIRILSNFETDKEKILQIVFFAQSEIVSRLQSEHMKYLAQRITVTCALKPLDREETGLYINYRLLKAGAKAFPRFHSSAVKVIHEGSRGYPRLINVICDRCMLLLYSQSKNVVTGSIAKKALKEPNLALVAAKSIHAWKTFAAAILSAAACVLIILFRRDLVAFFTSLFLPSQ